MLGNGIGVRKLMLSLPTSSLCTSTRKRNINIDGDLNFKMLRMVTMTQPRVPVGGRIENVTLKLISTSGTGNQAATPSL